MLALEVGEAEMLNVATMEDFEKLHPGRVSEIREWFRTYKTLDGKPENKFTEDGRVYTRDETLRIVFETNKSYRELMAADCTYPEKKDFWLEKAKPKSE